MVVFGTNIDIKEIDLSNIYAIPVILIVQYMIQLVVNIGEVYIRKKITFIFLTIILGTKMKLTLFLKNIIGKKAVDTPTTWRIRDGTAAFYNYVYYTVAGFTEHDTFRSNQIREGDITRDEALKLVKEENRPRYPNIKWYLDALAIDYNKAISIVNKIPKLYEN